MRFIFLWHINAYLHFYANRKGNICTVFMTGNFAFIPCNQYVKGLWAQKPVKFRYIFNFFLYTPELVKIKNTFNHMRHIHINFIREHFVVWLMLFIIKYVLLNAMCSTCLYKESHFMIKGQLKDVVGISLDINILMICF